MKTFILFLALLVSFYAILDIIAALLTILATAIIERPKNLNSTIKFGLGFVSICLWTYFYYLTL